MPLHYQSGFGNEFATEALPGALPIGRNSPQRAPYGLYAEQLSGTAFTAPRHANRRSWLYRIRPAAVHGPFEAVQIGRVVGSFDELPVSPDQLRWDPLPLPHGPADFLEGFPPRWLTAEDTFRPPWFHRNFASEFMGLIHGAYDAKAEGFAPGGASLHNCMRGHGPDAETFARASVADTSRPHHVADTMAFMFETPAVIRPTVYALESAQLQNLPLGVFRRAGTDEIFRGGVAIGDQIVDLGMAASRGALSPEALPFAAACGASSLNSFMAMGPNAWSALRLALSRALRIGAPERELLSACLVPQSRAEYTVPAKIGDYTDFYTSIHHATSVGKLFRPDNPIAAAIWSTAIR